MVLASKQAVCGLVVKNTFLDIDDSDTEHDGGSMCKLKTQPCPRRPSFEEFLSDASEDADYQSCLSEDSTDDECPRATAMGMSKVGLTLPIPKRTLEDFNFVTDTPSCLYRSTPMSASTGTYLDSSFVTSTPSTVSHLTRRSSLPIRRRTSRLSWADAADTPGSTHRSTPGSRSSISDTHQQCGFAAPTPSTVGHLTQKAVWGRCSDDEISNSMQDCAAAFPKVGATSNLVSQTSAQPSWSLAGESIEKTAWEKFEEVVDGLQQTLSSYRGLVVKVKVAEGAQGWTLTAFVDPEKLASCREHLQAGSQRALIMSMVALESVYLLGFQQPFVPTEFGFTSTLGLMTDPACACWDTFATGFCPFPGCCQKQHPNGQNKAKLSIMFKPA